MTNPLAPKRLTGLAASTTAVLAAVAGASHAAGAPDTLVAATAGVLAVGGASITAAIHSRTEAAR